MFRAFFDSLFSSWGLLKTFVALYVFRNLPILMWLHLSNAFARIR